MSAPTGGGKAQPGTPELLTHVWPRAQPPAETQTGGLGRQGPLMLSAGGTEQGRRLPQDLLEDGFVTCRHRDNPARQRHCCQREAGVSQRQGLPWGRAAGAEQGAQRPWWCWVQATLRFRPGATGLTASFGERSLTVGLHRFRFWSPCIGGR